jgi:hypothetical protein
MLGMPAADETGWMTVALFQSGCAIESSGGRESSGSIGGVMQDWSPYIDVILYCCSTRPGEG